MHRRVFLAALVLPLAVGGCVQQRIAQGQVESTLVQAGLSRATSQCIAHRLLERLSVKQLRRLATLSASSRSVAGYVAAVQQVNDPELTRVTISSAALCATGMSGE